MNLAVKEIDTSVAEYICDQLLAGRSMIDICKEKNVPSERTVYYWMEKNEDFCRAITRARSWQADHFLDEQIALAKSATIEDWQLKKFQADNLKWVAAKLAPKKYGDKQTLDVNQTMTLSALVEQAIKIKDVTPDSIKTIEHAPQSRSDSQLQANRVETIEDYL